MGINPNIKPGIGGLDDRVFIYSCGNNIVIYNSKEKTQKYISGTDGTQGISMFELSPCKNYLAVCEKSS